MSANILEDPILRENRRWEVARRLILHGVRTQLVSHFTGLTRSRLATVRRRLMVREDSRFRGPMRNPLNVFFGTPRGRSEGAALAMLLSSFEVPLHGAPPSAGSASLELADRLCETYEAFLSIAPATKLQLEDLITLRNLLAKHGSVQVGRCRCCKCLILIDRFNPHPECSHCSNPQEARSTGPG